MKEDFDFITMDNYRKDMDESTALASNIIHKLTKELNEAKACIAWLVKAAGRIEIQRDFISPEPPSYEITENVYHNTIVFRPTDN